MNPRCDWFADEGGPCPHLATEFDGEYHHCDGHWKRHLDFQREEEVAAAAANRPKPTLVRPVAGSEVAEQRLAEVRRLATEGYDTPAIARELGVSTDTARKLRRDAGVPFRPHAPCGTRSGFARHKNYGEQPCNDCTEAEAEYMRAWAQRRRERRRRAS